MKLTIAFLLVSGAIAACPNACSHHGECGEYDSCTCHKGFQGGDCSERVCLYNWAWVTTANGDLNFDGDLYDGTVYSKTVALTSATDTSTGVGGSSLRTQANPGGHWETWPYYGSAQEGHYYMECSNRGLCDRSTGDCVCFDGYTGTACNRMQCPEDCSDHGVCQTVKDYDSTYNYWDRDMARSCKCDPGYTGPACQTRQCPHGNDPLTKTNELWETQFVDIYSECEGTASTTGCGTFSATSATLGGYARLTYTDHHGEAYTTAPFAVKAYDSDSTADAVATAAEDALKALPNDVISDQITVTAGYCEVTLDAHLDQAATADAASVPTRILTAAYGKGGTDTTAVYAADGKVLVVGASGVAQNSVGAVTGGEGPVAALANPFCIRLRIDFVGMPGDLVALTVDHSDVTYFGETNSQNSGANVGSSVTSDQAISHAALSVGYTRPSTVQVVATGDGSATGAQINIAAKTITFVANTMTGVTDTFQPNSKIKVECHYDLNGDSTTDTYRSLGIYTVSSATVPTATVITVLETIVANGCTSAFSTIRVTQVSNVITIGDHDLTKTTTVAQGHRVRFVVTTGSVVKEVDTTVQSVEYHGTTGFIILTQESSDALAADVTAGAATLTHDGDGTRENVECSDRGLCGEDGVCKCFTGYTGDDCSQQKSIQY